MAALVSIGGFDFPESSTYNATTSTIVVKNSVKSIQTLTALLRSVKECRSYWAKYPLFRV
jgi:hypothetical protein